jgi:AcrR family transcriptional regulator
VAQDTVSRSRRAAERAATRERIIETALSLLESEGMAALTMRRVATDMEYTAPIVYQHFTSKDALVVELVAHGYRLLAAAQQEVMEEADADGRLLRAASTYMRFARDHPDLYDAMNGATMDPERRREIIEPTLALLEALLADWATRYDVDLGDPSDACDVVWGTLYGMASLGRLDVVGNERAQRLATEALSAVLHGWRIQKAR